MKDNLRLWEGEGGAPVYFPVSAVGTHQAMEDEMAACVPRQSSSIRSLASGRGDKRAYFNFLLGPPHDKGEISPNIIISQKNTLWNHKKGNTEKPDHGGCPLNQELVNYGGGTL